MLKLAKRYRLKKIREAVLNTFKFWMLFWKAEKASPMMVSTRNLSTDNLQVLMEPYRFFKMVMFRVQICFSSFC